MQLPAGFAQTLHLNRRQGFGSLDPPLTELHDHVNRLRIRPPEHPSVPLQQKGTADALLTGQQLPLEGFLDALQLVGTIASEAVLLDQQGAAFSRDPPFLIEPSAGNRQRFGKGDAEGGLQVADDGNGHGICHVAPPDSCLS